MGWNHPQYKELTDLTALYLSSFISAQVARPSSKDWQPCSRLKSSSAYSLAPWPTARFRWLKNIAPKRNLVDGRNSLPPWNGWKKHWIVFFFFSGDLRSWSWLTSWPDLVHQQYRFSCGSKVYHWVLGGTDPITVQECELKHQEETGTASAKMIFKKKHKAPHSFSTFVPDYKQNLYLKSMVFLFASYRTRRPFF